jgi:hypothetical protein
MQQETAALIQYHQSIIVFGIEQMEMDVGIVLMSILTSSCQLNHMDASLVGF